jgi:hypothetical protein
LGFFVLVPIVIADGFILMLFCHLTIKQAGIAVAILLGYQIVLYMVMSKLFAMPSADASAILNGRIPNSVCIARC